MGYLAYENITVKGIEISVRQAKEASLRKGIIANVLSPYPYLFWMTVGAPTVLKAFGVEFSVGVLVHRQLLRSPGRLKDIRSTPCG